MVLELNLFTKKLCKIATAKKVFEGFFSICLLCLTVILPSFSTVQCANFLKYSESFGKSNENKWSQIWKFMLKNGIKLQWQKKFFLRIFFVWSLRLKVFMPPIPEVKCPFFSFFLVSFGKIIVKKWLHIVKLLLMKGLKSPCKKS